MTGVKLFDLHCDTLYECYHHGESLIHNAFHVDIEHGRRYTPWCQVFAVWIPDTLRGDAAWQTCCKMLAYAKGQATAADGIFRFAHTAEALEQAVVDGCPVGILAVEGGAALGGDLSRISQLAARGVRVLTLTWNGSCELGNGCLSSDRRGLTAFGKQVVSELPMHGIVPDVSHLNEAGFWDVAACMDMPFVASHSASFAVTAHPRNLTDRQFEVIRDRGGLVGLTACPSHLGECSLDSMYRHISHFLERGGEHTVSLGFDLDGTEISPDFQGVLLAEKLAEYLLSHRLNQQTVENLCFNNAYRFFSRILP